MFKIFKVIIINILVLFIFLKIADYSIKKIEFNKRYKNSQNYELQQKESYIKKINEKLFADAKIKNFKTYVYPFLYDYGALKKIAEEYSIAPLGLEPKKSYFYCNEGYGLKTFTTDRFGFVNDDKLWDKKKQFDILLISDSFGLSSCVKESNSIDSIIKKQNLSIINLSHGGNDPYIYASLIKSFQNISYKNLVIMFYSNDNQIKNNNNIFYQIYFKKNQNYLDNNFNLNPNLKKVYEKTNNILKQEKSNFLPDIFIFKKKKIFLEEIKNFFNFPYLKSYLSFYLKFYNNVPFSTKLTIEEAEKICILPKCKIHVVYINPSTFWRYDLASDKYSKSLADYLKKKKINFLNTNDIFSPDNEENYAPYGPHLSISGYKKL